MEDEVEEVLESFDELEEAVKKIEDHIKKIGKFPLKQLSNSIAPLESAKLHGSLAFALDSLFFMYLKTQGVSTKDHPIKKELDRIKKYIRKIENASKKEEPTGRRIDKKAAARFIQSGMGGKRKF
mmetsp:Transcript_9594/g.14378  ORF Transcript_9594/g.14378 Transcript_9594/m.14378 type:complete len:125 (+) Transcript_9594:32-406(+)|eukprot:CAMPEP_0167758474 /NCGR_PEP_ID=MMETSP0110_2-20121227/10487_1 /TAXON_ID=629695 /ORGANISM="Gymnochlora sp., Strain CCMP2014" /LENGTH=124 /DNA_ID=CAMNT_0007644751 /DNA_START=32 /DNA_END=406 /DNA_ORIENTATION=+